MASNDEHHKSFLERAKALADLSFTYVVSYEREETTDAKSPKVFYSVLLKGGGKFDEVQENCMQVIALSIVSSWLVSGQNNYFEETFKLRNVLEEFQKERVGRRKPTILGHREHIFTGSVSSLAWFMSNQESNFVTVGQRILANPLRLWLATQSIFQLGFLMVLPMVMEIGLEEGFRSAILDFFIMQFQLASMLFTFQLGTKSHYYGRTILHGGSKYRPTGRGFVVFHAKFAENSRLYSRSHFVKELELLLLLIVYQVYGHSFRSSNLFLEITVSMWFMVGSWLFAPFIFNPSGFG
ncbi:hypothetical protein N665_1151s0021 [Sinapis alba]|nr:hypothetical protein N665_1151s0021 [Sinapis alba]